MNLPAESGDDGQRVLADLLDSFAERLRRGERPSVDEYVAEHPELAEDIRGLFQALLTVHALATATQPQGAAPIAGAAPRCIADYRIVREVGRGGMGVVYEAAQESLNRRVALKVLPHQALGDRRRVERFRREAQAAAKLHHTNIVPVFAVGEDQGVHYYAMQLIEGRGLDRILRELRKLAAGGGVDPAGDDPVPDDELSQEVALRFAGNGFELHDPVSEKSSDSCTPSGSSGASAAHDRPTSGIVADSGTKYFRGVARLGLQVAEALSYAHGEGILHRDIKPSNLLLEPRGTVWVSDFGLAKTIDADGLTHTGGIVGTLRYMAPERFQGVCDARSDVYSLGLTLYELLTMRPAFQDADQHRLMKQIAETDPARPRQVNERIPRDLETIVLKASHKRPGQRYQSASLAADDLRQFLAGRPISARRTSVPERSWLWCRRNPLVATLTFSVTALLVTLTLGALLSARNLRDQLRSSYLAQAQASRWSGRPGRRSSSLEALARASEIRPGLDLRNEAVACLALRDVAPAGTVDGWSKGLAFGVSADYARYATERSDGSITVRRLTDGSELALLPACALDPALLRFSSDAGHLAVKYHTDAEIRLELWDLARRKSILSIPNGVHEEALDFSPDGRRLVAGRRSASVHVYDVATGTELHRFAVNAPPARIRFHPSARTLAVASWESDLVEVRDAESGVVLQALKQPSVVASIAWSDDGNRLAAGCANGQVSVWDMSSGQACDVFKGHGAEVVQLAFNHRGDLLATTGWDTTTRLWDLASRELIVTSTDFLAHFSADDRYCGIGDGELLEVTGGRQYRAAYRQARLRDLSCSPIGGLVASAGADGVVLWALAEGRIAGRISAGLLESAVFDPNGRTLFTSGQDGIQAWPIENQSGTARVGLPVSFDESKDMKLCIARDGRTLVGAGRGHVDVYDVPTRVKRLRLLDIRRTGVISPSGRWLALVDFVHAGVSIWDLDSGSLARTLETRQANVCFSPDGKWLVTGSRTNEPTDSGSWYEYVVWRVGSWEKERTLPCADVAGRSPGAAFSQDGRMMAVSSGRTTVRLLDAVDFHELATLEAAQTTPVMGFSFGADDRYLVVAEWGKDSLIGVWDLDRVREGLRAMRLDW